jgi:hypothetical protein
LATKFTYKKRSGGKRDVGSGTSPAQTNILKNELQKVHAPQANRKPGEKKMFIKMYLKAEFCKYLAGLDSLKADFL